MRNPFKPTAGAEPPYLIGRESSLESFIEGLQDGPGSPGLLSLITGPRGIGKTALLHRSEKFAKEYGWAVVSETATPGLLARIGSSVDEHLKRPGEGRSGRKVTGLHAAGFGITAELTPEEQVSLRRRLTDLVTRLAERHQTGVLITVTRSIRLTERSSLSSLQPSNTSSENRCPSLSSAPGFRKPSPISSMTKSRRSFGGLTPLSWPTCRSLPFEVRWRGRSRRPQSVSAQSTSIRPPLPRAGTPF